MKPQKDNKVKIPHNSYEERERISIKNSIKRFQSYSESISSSFSHDWDWSMKRQFAEEFIPIEDKLAFITRVTLAKLVSWE